MVSVQLVVNAGSCDVLQLRGTDHVNIVFMFLRRSDLGKSRKSFKIKKSKNVKYCRVFVCLFFSETRHNVVYSTPSHEAA